MESSGAHHRRRAGAGGGASGRRNGRAEDGGGRRAPGRGERKMVWAVPCDCTTGDRTERALQRSRVPERSRHCDFENYESDNDIKNVSREQMAAWNRSLAQAKLMVQRFADEFPV